MAKYILEVDDDVDFLLAKLGDSNTTKAKADVLRKAVATYKFLNEQLVSDKNASVAIVVGKEIKTFVNLP